MTELTLGDPRRSAGRDPDLVEVAPVSCRRNRPDAEEVVQDPFRGDGMDQDGRRP